MVVKRRKEADMGSRLHNTYSREREREREREGFIYGGMGLGRGANMEGGLLYR